MQVPSNMIINKIQRPSWYIGAAILLWGMISTLSGNVQNFEGMVAVRFFLGFVEAAFLRKGLPYSHHYLTMLTSSLTAGALLIQSKWYTRRELTMRNAILFSGNLISNAFSALVAAGVLSNMQGVLGHAAWRWLFWSTLTLSNCIAYADSRPSRGRFHHVSRNRLRLHPARSAEQLSRLHGRGTPSRSAAHDGRRWGG